MSSSLQAAQARYDTALANFYAQWGTDSKSHSVIPPQDHVWCEVQDAQAQLEAAQKAAKAVNNAYHAFAAETGSTGIDSAHPSASTSLAETQKTRAAAEGLVGLDAINTLSQALESATNITPSNNNSSNSVSSPRNSCFVNVSKDRAIWPKLIPLAFQNCQNEKAVEKKAVQGLAELRFQYFVPLYDLKGEVARLGALRQLSDEQAEDLAAKKSILEWREKHPGVPMPSLVHYAKDRMDTPSTLTEVLRGISDIEQFYINLYHEFQEAIPLKDKIIEALSYQDLYALEVFREMKRENPSLVQSPAVIAQAFQGRMQQAARAAYAHKPLVAYYVENNIKQLRESEKTEIEALQKDVAALENLKQKLKEMDSDKPGLEEAVKKIKAKIQQLEQRDPHTNLQIKLSEISEKAVSRAVQENLPLVIAVGFIEPGQWHKKILDLLEGPSEKISKQYPHLLEKEEEYIVTKRADISLYVEVTLSRYVENGKLLPKQKGEILEEIEDLITHYQTVFPNKEIHSLCGLCLMAARNMVYQEYYNGAVFTGCDHGVKHIRHSILMANKCIKHLIRWAINERDIFAIQLVHIFHAFGYSIGFAGDHSIVSAAFLNANRRFLVDVLDEDMFDAVVRSVEKHPYIHPDFTPEMNRSRNKVQSSFVRAVTSLSYYCSLATNGKTQDFWMDLEAMLIASRLKVFVTNHPEYGDKFNPPRPQTYAENYRNQLIGSPNAMDRLAAEIYDGVLQDCKKLIKDTPGMPEHIKERFLRGIEQNFSYFAANLVVGQVGVTIEEVVLIPREGASIKFVPSFDIPPSTLYSILEVGFGDEEPFSANDKLLKEFTPAPERIEEAIKQAAAKTREIYSTKARFDDEYLQMTTIMKRLSYGKDNARIDGQLRGGQVDADLFPNVAFNATELLTALDLLKRINDHWKKELKPINELFDKEQPQKVINKYVKELESLRDDPSKFTVVNELTDKYKKQFSDLDSFYSEMGIETKFQETFEKGTKTIAQGLCPLAKKWAEGEKLFKLCYTYLTTHNIDVREVFFLVPGKKDIYNELALLKKEATDKLVAQIMEVQKVV